LANRIQPSAIAGGSGDRPRGTSTYAPGSRWHIAAKIGMILLAALAAFDRISTHFSHLLTPGPKELPLLQLPTLAPY
jgi:hypothetical protein